METSNQLKRKCEDEFVSGFVKKSKYFEKDPSINESDNFSNLNNDCLFEIFSYLAVPDLARLSATSQRLHIATKPLSAFFYAKVNKIGLMGTKCGNFVISVARKDKSSTKDKWYEISESGPENFVEMDEDLWHSPKPYGSETRPVSSSIIAALGAIMRRIRPRELRIKNVQVDDALLTKVKEIFGKRSITRLELKEIRFGDHDPHIARKFMQWVISTCPSHISLWEMGMHSTKAIDADFLRTLSEAVPHPHLTITDFRFRDELTLLASTDEMEAILPRFVTLKADFVILRTERLMRIAMERFRSGKVGFWQIGTTRQLEKEDIEAGIGNEFRIDQVTNSNEGSHYVIKAIHPQTYCRRQFQISVDREETSVPGGPGEYSVRIHFY